MSKLLFNSGVYKISIGDRFYIGSSRDLRIRFREHLKKLKKGKHQNPYMQKVYNKYEETYKIEVLLYCDEEDRFFYEQRFLDYYFLNKKDSIMNLSSKADYPVPSKEARKRQAEKVKGNTNALGYRHTEEALKKIGEASKGNKNTLGYRHTPEEIKKISDASKGNKNNLGKKFIGRKIKNGQVWNKGKKLSPEHIEKLRNKKTNKGWKPSEETLERMRVAAKLRIEKYGDNLRSKEINEKSGLARRGLKKSDEHKKKIGDANRGKPSWHKGKKRSRELVERCLEIRRLNKLKKLEEQNSLPQDKNGQLFLF